MLQVSYVGTTGLFGRHLVGGMYCADTWFAPSATIVPEMSVREVVGSEAKAVEVLALMKNCTNGNRVVLVDGDNAIEIVFLRNCVQNELVLM